MTAQNLIDLGFDKVEFAESFWFELKYGRHRFLTNDYRGNDHWWIGYENTHTNEEPFWFNGNLIDEDLFPSIFSLLTGKYHDNWLAKKKHG